MSSVNFPESPGVLYCGFNTKHTWRQRLQSERCLLKIKLVRSSHTNHNVLKTVPTAAVVCEQDDEEMNLVC